MNKSLCEVEEEKFTPSHPIFKQAILPDFQIGEGTGLTDTPGRGRKARLPTGKISLIVERATRPLHGRVRWSVR
jgi:hypothetical protein